MHALHQGASEHAGTQVGRHAPTPSQGAWRPLAGSKTCRSRLCDEVFLAHLESTLWDHSPKLPHPLRSGHSCHLLVLCGCFVALRGRAIHQHVGVLLEELHQHDTDCQRNEHPSPQGRVQGQVAHPNGSYVPDWTTSPIRTFRHTGDFLADRDHAHQKLRRHGLRFKQARCRLR